MAPDFYSGSVGPIPDIVGPVDVSPPIRPKILSKYVLLGNMVFADVRPLY